MKKLGQKKNKARRKITKLKWAGLGQRIYGIKFIVGVRVRLYIWPWFFQQPKQNGRKVIRYRICFTHMMILRRLGFSLKSSCIAKGTSDAFLLLKRLILNCSKVMKSLTLAEVDEEDGRISATRSLCLGCCSNILLCSFAYRETQECWKLKTSLKILWGWEGEPDPFFSEGKPFIMKNFCCILLYS